MLKPVPMTHMAVIGLRRNTQVIISILHDVGVVQLEPMSKYTAPMLVSRRETGPHKDPILSDQLLRMRALKAALPPSSVERRQFFKSTDELVHAAKDIDIDGKVGYLERQKEDLLTQLKDTENNLRLVEEFSFFPEDLGILNLSCARSYFCRMASEKFAEFTKAIDLWKKDIFLYYKEDKEITHFILVLLPNLASQALAWLVQWYGVNLEPVPNLVGKPSNLIQDQENKKIKISKKLQDISDQLSEISREYYGNIVSIQEQLEIENKKLEVTDNLGFTSDTFALEGWVPKSKLDEIRMLFDRNARSTAIYELETKEKPPTLLSNPKRFGVFESFVRFYSLPSGDEFDPTIIFGLIFPLFYGMMLGDVGYGLVILIVCMWVIRRVEGRKRHRNIIPSQLRNFAKRTPIQTVKLAKAMIPGAIVAIILGFMFNLYFGFHLNSYLFYYLSKMGLHLPSDGAFLDPIGSLGLRKLLLISGYIGLGMVSFGLVLGILNALRQAQKRQMIGKVGWLLFGWGIVLIGLALLHHSHINSAYFGLIFAGMGLMFYGEGVRAVMELPSIISHILSYTRIVGILLASVILARLIDLIFINSLHQSLPYIVLGITIFFIGQISNIILGVFEAGIQGSRLLYVEFFSKFYLGNGTPFRPFGTIRKFTVEQYNIDQSANNATSGQMEGGPTNMASPESARRPRIE